MCQYINLLTPSLSYRLNRLLDLFRARLLGHTFRLLGWRRGGLLGYWLLGLLGCSSLRGLDSALTQFLGFHRWVSLGELDLLIEVEISGRMLEAVLGKRRVSSESVNV